MMEITLDYSDSDNESLETRAPMYDTSYSTLAKIRLIERQIKALEDPKKNTDFCKICNAELKSPIHARTHYISKKHEANVALLRERFTGLSVETLQDYVILESLCCVPNSAVCSDEGKFHCSICNIPQIGTWEMVSHQNGEMHKRNLERFCDLRTTSKEAPREFFSHSRKLENVEIPSIPAVYVSPKISPKKLRKVETNKQTDLQQNVTWNCDVCHETFEEKDVFVSHKAVFPHVVLEELKIRYTPEIVDAVCSVNNGRIFCSLCNAKVQSVTDTKSHLNSSKHLTRFDRLLQDLFMKENKTTQLDNLETEIKKRNHEEGTNYEVNIAGIKTEKEVQEKLLEINSFYCYVCKLKFDSKAKMDEHAMNFPHAEVVKLKSELVSAGVSYAEYWVQSTNYYTCTLCDAKITSDKISGQHCSGFRHRQRLSNWCKEFATWKCGPVVDPKYFYCTTCSVPLAGTSEAELHYNMENHLKRMELNYDDSSLSTNPIEGILQDHNARQESRESKGISVPATSSKTYKESLPVANQDNSSDKLNTLDNQKLLPKSTDISLKQQLYRELEKIVDILYHSKALPFDVSLQYAKKINREIENLKRKYQGRAADFGNFSEKGNLKIQTASSNNGDGVDDSRNWLYYDTNGKQEQIRSNVNDVGIANTPSCLYDARSKPEQTISDNNEADVANASNCLYDNTKTKSEHTISSNNGGDVADTSSSLHDSTEIKPEQTISSNNGVDVADTSSSLHDNTKIKPEQTISSNNGVDVADTLRSLHTNTKIKPEQTLSNNEVAEFSINVKSNLKKRKKRAVKNVDDTHSSKEGTGSNEPNKSARENEILYTVNEQHNDNGGEPGQINFNDMLKLINSKKGKCGVHNILEVELLNQLETLIKCIDSNDTPLNIILWFLHKCNEELQVVIDNREADNFKNSK